MRGRDPAMVNLVDFVKGTGKLTFDPEPMFDHLAKIEMAHCVGRRLVLPTLVKPTQFEVTDVRFGLFPVMLSKN